MKVSSTWFVVFSVFLYFPFLQYLYWNYYTFRTKPVSSWANETRPIPSEESLKYCPSLGSQLSTGGEKKLLDRLLAAVFMSEETRSFRNIPLAFSVNHKKSEKHSNLKGGAHIRDLFAFPSLLLPIVLLFWSEILCLSFSNLRASRIHESGSLSSPLGLLWWLSTTPARFREPWKE